MKDCNLREINSDLKFPAMALNVPQMKKLRSIIRSDSMFLRNLGLMDYSLLLVVE